MKAQKICFLSNLILVIAFTASCAQATSSPQILSSPTPTLLVNTITPTLTLTPSPTDSPTDIPTLSVELARTRLLELLAKNSNCHLPCLWGIAPGSSTYQDARDILAPLASIAFPMTMNLSSSPGSIDLSYIEDDTEIDIHLSFLYGNDDIVNRIAFQVRDLKRVVAPDGESMYQNIFDSKTFDERMSAYMLPQVLTEQGIPAAVLLQTNGALVKYSGGFRILLFYPEQGLLINYETQMKITGDKVRGCFANAHVEFELYPSGHPDTYSEMLDQTQWGGLWPPPTDNIFWKPIEKAASMTLEQFYEAFRQPTDKCIETPVNLWPIP